MAKHGRHDITGAQAASALITFAMVFAICVAALADDAEPIADIEVRRLDLERQGIQPSLGATRYDFGQDALQAIPQADNAALNQVLLQAPGVAEDSFGQIHLRGEHANVQYRLDGVQLPEGLSVFGQAIESRFARELSLLTGALPAQYGLNTAGVVDIQTKSGTTDPGLVLSMYGGSFGWVQPSFEYGGRSGALDWFVTGDFLRNDRGIEDPTPSYSAVHDRTDQLHGLAHLSYVIDTDTRVSLIAGAFSGNFEIPNNPGQTPGLGLTVRGVLTLDSAALDENQREVNDFAILSLQRHFEDADVQASLFGRYSGLTFSPDPLGDLLFNGIAQAAHRSDAAGGIQADASWRIADTHTLRSGFVVEGERATFRTTSSVLPLDAGGAQIGDVPVLIGDRGGKTGGIYGLYLQDEWRVLPAVTLNYGLRFDLVNEFTNENQISPRINLVWKATDTTTVTAGYARYFVPPPFELVSPRDLALFANTTAAPAVDKNGTVKAERSNYYDIGVSQTVMPGLSVGADGYFKQAKNLIDEGQFGAPIILTAFNYARGQQAGAQLTASYDRNGLSFYGNLAYSRAIGRDIISAEYNFGTDELAYIARHFIHLDHDQRWTGSAGASYAFERETEHALRVSADLSVQSGLRATQGAVPNGVALRSFTVVNLSASQHLDLGLGARTELRLDVLNVFDSTYEIRDGSGVGVGAPQFGIRRAVLAGVAQRF